MIPSLMKRTRFSSSSSILPQGTKPSLKDTTYVAKFSVSLEPERTKIVDPRNTYGNPAQTYYGHWSRETTCKTVLYLFRAVALVHAPTIPNWVLPVAGPLYGVSKYFFTSRNPPAPIQRIPLSLLAVAAAVPFYPILHPPPLPRFIPALFEDKGYAYLYLKAADRMKCTMELSPHVARFSREVKDAFLRSGPVWRTV